MQSTTTFNGEKTIVKYGMRTSEELDALGVSRETRDEFYQHYQNRHFFLKDVRDAGLVLQGKGEAKTEKGKAEELKWAEGIRDQVEAGTVFDLEAFMPSRTGRIPAELKVHWEQAKAYYAAAKDDEAKVAKAVEKFGEFSVEAIARALKAIADAQPDLFE